MSNLLPKIGIRLNLKDGGAKLPTPDDCHWMIDIRYYHQVLETRHCIPDQCETVGPKERSGSGSCQQITITQSTFIQKQTGAADVVILGAHLDLQRVGQADHYRVIYVLYYDYCLNRNSRRLWTTLNDFAFGQLWAIYNGPPFHC